VPVKKVFKLTDAKLHVTGPALALLLIKSTQIVPQKKARVIIVSLLSPFSFF
jgi:hypothetical protein